MLSVVETSQIIKRDFTLVSADIIEIYNTNTILVLEFVH